MSLLVSMFYLSSKLNVIKVWGFSNLNQRTFIFLFIQIRICITYLNHQISSIFKEDNSVFEII